MQISNENVHLLRCVMDEVFGSDNFVSCLGPEFGAVGPGLVRRAAVQANRSIGCATLLICGFAFDPHVAEEGQVVEKQLGRVKVLTVRMNADLAMGDALKNTGSGNLFLVFGEPDIELKKQPGGRWVVAIRGLDVFDPTTGEVRSGGTEDVACWFVGTDYDGESFFVRDAYFCGGGDPDEKLRRALKADIDEPARLREAAPQLLAACRMVVER